MRSHRTTHQQKTLKCGNEKREKEIQNRRRATKPKTKKFKCEREFKLKGREKRNTTKLKPENHTFQKSLKSSIFRFVQHFQFIGQFQELAFKKIGFDHC